MAAKFQVLIVIGIVALLYVAPSTASYSTSTTYIMRSTQTYLVLDGKYSSYVSTQIYNGDSSQLWRFETGTRPGLFYIINTSNNKVLDINAGTISDSFSGVFLNTKGYSSFQQWYINSNGTLVNAQLNKRLITMGTGSDLSVWATQASPLFNDIYNMEDNLLSRSFRKQIIVN